MLAHIQWQREGRREQNKMEQHQLIQQDKSRRKRKHGQQATRTITIP